MTELIWYAFLGIVILFFLGICAGVAYDYVKDLRGWVKYVGFTIAFIFAVIVFYLFSGNVPEWGR